MPTTDPVVVPVELDITRAQTALGLFGQQVQTMRGAVAGGAAPPGGAGGPPATTGLPTPTLAGLLREMQALESSATRLTQIFDRIARQQDANAPAAVAGAPAPLVQMPGQPGIPASDQARQAVLQRADALGGDIGRTMRETMVGMLSIAGIGIGVGAAVRDVSQMFEKTKQLGVELFRATLQVGAGGTTVEYREMERMSRFAGGTAIERMVSPLERARGERQLIEAGMYATGPAPIGLIGAAGIRAFGEPGPAFGMAAQQYGTFRNERVGELMGTLVVIGRENNVSAAEMLKQMQGLRGFWESRQGQFRRSDDQLTEVAGWQKMLVGLPGEIGVGAGGVRITERLGAFGAAGTGGIQETIGMRAYMADTGEMPLGDPAAHIRYIKWSQSPRGMAARAREAVRMFGPDRAALMISEYGQALPMEVAERLVRGDLNTQQMEALISREKLMDPRGGPQSIAGNEQAMEELLRTVGGEAVETEAKSQRNQTEEIWLTKFLLALEKWKAEHPHMAPLIEVLIGLVPAILAFAGPAALLRLLPLIKAMRKLGKVRKAATTAAEAGFGRGAATVAGAAAQRSWRGVPYVLPAMGAVDVVKDLLDAAGVTSDPTNTRDLLGGGFGALIGGILGIPGGPFGITMGALGGYEVGKSGLDLLLEAISPSEAGAALPPEGAGLYDPKADPDRPWQAGTGRIRPRRVPWAPVDERPPSAAAAAGGDLRYIRPGVIDVRSPFFRELERKYGIPAGLLSSMMIQESGVRGVPGGASPTVVNRRTGAAGLFQFMPGTGREYGMETLAERQDPRMNAIAAATMLRKHYDILGSWEKAVYAHYAGLGGARSGRNYYRRPARNEPSPAEYIQQIMARAPQYRGADDTALAGPTEPAVEMPRGPYAGFSPEGAGGSSGEVNVYLHMDPSFPGKLTSSSKPGVVVRKAS